MVVLVMDAVDVVISRTDEQNLDAKLRLDCLCIQSAPWLGTPREHVLDCELTIPAIKVITSQARSMPERAICIYSKGKREMKVLGTV